MSDSTINKQAVDSRTMLISPGKTLDNNNAHHMVEAISAAQVEGFQNIVVNMSRLEFLSSAGVGSILGTVETSREAGGDIILCGVPDNIMHVLDVLDLTDYLTIRKTDEEAFQACGVKVNQ